MSSFKALSTVAAEALDSLQQQQQSAFAKLAQDINSLTADVQDQGLSEADKFEGLDQLQLIQSRAVDNKKQEPTDKTKKRRVKEIEDQKRQIAKQLRQLEDEIDVIKGRGESQNLFRKRQKIQRDQQAKIQAEMLVKQLKNQRKEIEEKKRKQQEKFIQDMRKQEQERRKVREEEVARLKEERRQAIVQRMEEEKKKRDERRAIEAQSNNLIAKLKKQEKLQKQVSLAPSQLVDVDQRKRALQKKNNFSLQQIQQHDRKYRELKARNQKQKEERSESMKVQRHSNAHKYSRNVWIQRIEEEENRKKQQQQRNEQRRRSQLEKRLKYGELVKNIFLPKKKESSTSQDHVTEPEEKPKTPQQTSKLPKVKSTQNRTQISKMYREETAQAIRQSQRNRSGSRSIKQFSVEDDEQQKMRKIRELQLRKQTNQRLKKIQEQSHKPPKPTEKKKYENYLGQVKTKKEDGSGWKKIMENQNMTQEEKYRELMKKAGDLENKARKKQDKNGAREADEDAVNLYIGSIQAKLALLQKF